MGHEIATKKRKGKKGLEEEEEEKETKMQKSPLPLQDFLMGAAPAVISAKNSGFEERFQLIRIER